MSLPIPKATINLDVVFPEWCESLTIEELQRGIDGLPEVFANKKFNTDRLHRLMHNSFTEELKRKLLNSQEMEVAANE